MRAVGLLPQRALIAAICVLPCAPFASAQERINCPNGEIHFEIDVATLALTSFFVRLLIRPALGLYLTSLQVIISRTSGVARQTPMKG